MKRFCMFFIGVGFVCSTYFFAGDPPVEKKEVISPATVIHRKIVTHANRLAASQRRLQKSVLPVGYTPIPGGQPNYFGPEPNYANSSIPLITVKHNKVVSIKGGIRKFVDSLPGLGEGGKNNLERVWKFINLALR